MSKKKQKMKAVMTQPQEAAQPSTSAGAQPRKFANPIHIYDWKSYAIRNPEGYFDLQTEDTGDVPVRLFFTQELFDAAEDALYPQIVNATRFPGVKLVVITPDAHFGYGVPVGSVILTDGTLAMGPVGYDIGCFTYDTLVPTVDGNSYPIGELASSGKEMLVYSLDENRKIVVAKAIARRTRIEAPLVVVTLDNGREIVCTPDHEFMLRDGTYRQARHLLPNTSLMPFEMKVATMAYNHKVVSVELTARREDVYCLTVPGYGNFALDAGVLVHNCGMVSARSNVEAGAATAQKRLAFNKAVMERVEMGAGGLSKTPLRKLSEPEFVKLIHGGADYYISKYGASIDRSRAERNRIPVDDNWQVPWGGKGRPERGIPQLGSLGGGNHFIELQRSEETGTLFVQVHSGSRGFGHGLATNYFNLAKEEKPDEIRHLDMGYFTPDSIHYRSYLNAVAAGGNFAIINRLILFEQIADAFYQVFGAELELIYEISHNLVQREWHPDYGDVWVHRKGATRAFPAGHPALEGTFWEDTGHPILIPGSNHDYSYVLRPLPGAVKSGFSVNHGAGRKMSRSQAKSKLSQQEVNKRYAKDGIIVNANANVPLDEADAVYKSAEEVVAAVTSAGLAEITYRLWPLASLKGLD
jgi:tRNA-splicing ligase RtcB